MSSVTSFALLLTLPAIFGLLAPPCMAENILYSGNTLYAGSQLTYGSYSFTMQSDCNLVLYDRGSAVWASGTYNRARGCILRMQNDGNLVIYANNGGGPAVWASNSNRGQGYYVLILQRDRNVVIYGGAIWATASNAVGTPGVNIIVASRSQNATDVATVPGAAATNTTTTTTTSPEWREEDLQPAYQVKDSNRKKNAMATN